MEKIGIFILNYNGLNWLKKTIPKLILYNQYEADIIIIDNNSSDNSIKYIKSNFPSIKIKKNKKNYGFSKGYNQILLKEKLYDYFIIINNDVEVTLNWIKPMFDIIKKGEVGIVQPKIRNILKPNYFDYAGGAGGYIDTWCIPFCRGRILDNIEKDQNQYNSTREIFWASGCCFMIKRELFYQINGFDEDLFMHHEEIDLCWRVQSTKYEILFCPKSTVYHFGGGTINYNSPIKHYYNHRNNLLILSKNLPIKKLILTLPVRFLMDYLIICIYLIKGVYSAITKKKHHTLKIPFFIIKAHIMYLLLLPKFLQKRNPIKSKLIYPNSILIDYYFRKKCRFSDLKEF